MAVLGLIVHSSRGARTEGEASSSFPLPGQAVPRLWAGAPGHVRGKVGGKAGQGEAHVVWPRLTARPPGVATPRPPCASEDALASPPPKSPAQPGVSPLADPRSVGARFLARTLFLCEEFPSVPLSIISGTRFPVWCSNPLVTGFLILGPL